MDSRKPRRLLTIGHSFAVEQNRRLPVEIHNASDGRWDVTVVAPLRFEGNPRFGQMRAKGVALEPNVEKNVVGLRMFATRRIHVTVYEHRLRSMLAEGYDLVHCWQEPYMFAGGQVAWWTPRATAFTFLTFQNLVKQYPPPFSAIERYVAARADGWVAGGFRVEAALASRVGYRDRPHRVIPIGVDLEKFYPNSEDRDRVRASLGWASPGAPVVGYLGRLTEAKGLKVLMAALERVTTPWRALFVGSGELEPEVVEWGAKHGDAFRHVPNVPPERVPGYLNAFDILCAPSQSTKIWNEQFGRMLIESFACGVPVIASGSGEIPIVVGDAGILLPERDEHAWAEAITRLLDSQNLREEFAGLGLRRVSERYTWSKIGNDYVEFFDSILERRRNP